MRLGNKALIDHVIDRCLAAVPTRNVVLLTTSQTEDQKLEDHVKEKYGLDVYRGHSEDVRSRFANVAQFFNFEKIVRITADDPFKDPIHIREAIKALNRREVDYYNNFEVPLFPVGLDVESFRRSALLRNIEFDDSVISKEHVTYGLRYVPGFSREYKTGVPEFTKIRLTIDTKSDFNYCSTLLEVAPEMGHTAFSWETTRQAILTLEKDVEV